MREPTEETLDLGGTWRSCPADATLDRITSPEVLDAIGVTRIADVDGLDRLALPTVVAHRPLGRSLSSHQGKGIDRGLATISAVMEAAECDRAERFELVDVFDSARELAAKGHAHLVPWDLPGPRPLLFEDEAESARDRRWVHFEDLAGGPPVLVPRSLIRMDLSLEDAESRREACWLPPTTNGLAAGNSADEAVLHAICELVERHALADPHASVAVDPAAMTDPWIIGLCRELDRANIEVRLRIRFGRARDRSASLNIPSYSCVLVDHDPGPARRPASFGSGCHPSPRIAALRAITEAVQARTSLVAGARDDLLPSTYHEVHAGIHAGEVTHASASSVDPRPILVTSPKAMIEVCIRRLSDAGFPVVLARALETATPDAASGIPVWRTVIPGLHFNPGSQRWQGGLA